MEHERTIATTIRMPERIWLTLRQLAQQKALEAGGRPNVSAVVVAMVEARGAEPRPAA